MADRFVRAKFTHQFPFVGTVAQKALIEARCAKNEVSRASVIRDALDLYFSMPEAERDNFIERNPPSGDTYSEQFPFVGTPEQKVLIESEHKRRQVSRAQVVRDAITLRFSELTHG